MLLFILIMATVILFVPGITAAKAKQSAWLVPLFLPVLVGFTTIWTVWKLGQRFPQHTLVQYSVVLLGKAAGKLVAGAYILFFLVLNVLVIREFSQFLTLTMVPKTPPYILNIAVVLVGGYAAAKGIEVVARMTQFVFPLFVVGTLFIFVLAIPSMEPGKLLPLLEGGVLPIIRSSVTPASWYGEVIVLVMLLPAVNKPQEAKNRGYLAILAVAGFLSLDILITLGIFGPELTSYLQVPFWTLSKYIEFGNYLQRVESVVVVLWITGMTIKIALFSYVLALATAQVLGSTAYQPVLYPLALVQIIAASYPLINMAALAVILDQYWPPFALLFELVLPLFLLLVAQIRRKRGEGSW